MTDASYPHFDLSDAAARVFCRGCGAAYLRDVGVCSSCGSKEFVSREEARELEARREVRRPESLAAGGVGLVVTHGTMEENEVRLALEEAGIPYRTVVSRDVSLDTSAVFTLTTSASPDLSFFVAEEDLERANRVLDSMEAGVRAPGAGGPWQEDWPQWEVGEEDRFSPGAAGDDGEVTALSDEPPAASTLIEGRTDDDNPYGSEWWSAGAYGPGAASNPSIWSSRAARWCFAIVALALLFAYCAR